MRIIVILLLFFSFSSKLCSQDLNLEQQSNNISIINIKKNLFKTVQYDKENYWVSVGMGAYNKQYYSRDTFIAFMGASKSKELQPVFSYAIDWFSKYQQKDGYIPIWFQESMPKPNIYDLNIYLLAPYNLTEITGGIRQVDTVLQYIDAICIDYESTNDREKLVQRIPYLKKASTYIQTLTIDGLISTRLAKEGGPDWADLIRRSGKSSFLNAYWHYVNKKIINIYKELEMYDEASALERVNNILYLEFNKLFWVESIPTNCPLGKFGHYIGWVNNQTKADYFEIDSNSMAIIAGLSDDTKSNIILNKINDNFDYFINKYGASRNICGFYNKVDTRVNVGEYQNGGFWYIPIYFLSQAEIKMGKTSEFMELKRRVNLANIKFQTGGLREWYFINSDLGGAENYTWSLALPLFLNDLK